MEPLLGVKVKRRAYARILVKHVGIVNNILCVPENIYASMPEAVGPVTVGFGIGIRFEPLSTTRPTTQTPDL